MKLSYSPEDDALVITLKDEPVSYGDEVSDNVIAHYSAKDKLVEIEILRASSFFQKGSEVIVPEEAVLQAEPQPGQVGDREVSSLDLLG